MLVGMEDLTLATMGALNLEPEYADLPASFFEHRSRRAVEFAKRTIAGEFGPVYGQVLAGLHALDYDTGVIAGRVAAEAGLDGVTLGMFGALTDRNYVDYRVEDGNIIELAATVPDPTCGSSRSPRACSRAFAAPAGRSLRSMRWELVHCCRCSHCWRMVSPTSLRTAPPRSSMVGRVQRSASTWATLRRSSSRHSGSPTRGSAVAEAGTANAPIACASTTLTRRISTAPGNGGEPTASRRSTS